MKEDCIFCKIIKGDIPSEKVLENEDFVVIGDTNPRTKGHSLIIIKEHYENFLDIPRGLYEKLLITAKEAAEKLGAKNFNLVVNNGKDSGQLVSHFHMHIIPRKKDDGFKVYV